MAAMMGMRNTEDSARKSAATRAGFKRRKERGAPVGPVPLGYTVDNQVVDEDKRRVIDPATVGTVERIFDMVESGDSFGDIARLLNLEGVTGKRGKPWVSRTVSIIVHNEAYCGEKGYPKIIEPERFEDIHSKLERLDPAQVAKRRGGRKPVDDSYFLRGVAFCLRCGGTMYTRRQAAGRMYVCRNRRQSTGLCSAPPVPAELVESHVLRHLDTFVASIESWVQERVTERDSERRAREKALARQRTKLIDLERERERHLADYRKLSNEGKATARIASELVDRIDVELEEQQMRIAEAEAVVSEWSGPLNVDTALDYYSELRDLVSGRIRKADGAVDLNRRLRQLLAGLWAEVETDRARLLVEFELVEPTERVLPDGQKIMFERRPTLPPRRPDDRREPDPVADLGVRPWCGSSRSAS